MVPARFRDQVFMFFMTLLMGLSISAIMTWWNGGWQGPFVFAWLRGFARTYVVIVPTVLVVMPIAKRLTATVVAPPPG